MTMTRALLGRLPKSWRPEPLICLRLRVESHFFVLLSPSTQTAPIAVILGKATSRLRIPHFSRPSARQVLVRNEDWPMGGFGMWELWSTKSATRVPLNSVLERARVGWGAAAGERRFGGADLWFSFLK